MTFRIDRMPQLGMTFLAILMLLAALPAWTHARPIIVGAVDGVINPVSEEYIRGLIAKGEEDNAACVIIELNTPGGLMTSMEKIVNAELGAKVPVVVYVSPSGGRAASAGVFVTMAAHVAAMAPGTRIGAAHPVELSGGGAKDMGETMTEKVVNDAVALIRSIASQRGRNADWGEDAVVNSVSIVDSEAIATNVVNFGAKDLDALIDSLDGRIVVVNGDSVTLATKAASVVRQAMSSRQKFLDVIINPSIAYLLLMLGLLGLYFEISTPGAILPGVVGVISLLLAGYALQQIPINFAGILLIIFGMILFILELKIVSHGLLTIGGIISVLLGSIMLTWGNVEFMRISLGAIIPTVAVLALLVVLVVYKVYRVQRQRQFTGAEGLPAARGTVKKILPDQILVEVEGEIWRAESADALAVGDDVTVLTTEGLRLTVAKVRPA